MNVSQIPPFPFANLDGTTAAARASFDAAAKAYAGWAKGANALQAEALRFVADRLRKDWAMLARFGSCAKPEDLVNLQSEAATELVNDYLEEGARWIALLGESAQQAAAATPKAAPK